MPASPVSLGLGFKAWRERFLPWILPLIAYPWLIFFILAVMKVQQEVWVSPWRLSLVPEVSLRAAKRLQGLGTAGWGIRSTSGVFLYPSRCREDEGGNRKKQQASRSILALSLVSSVEFWFWGFFCTWVCWLDIKSARTVEVLLSGN